jgi:DNA-binding MarR family transcriptional regulator
MLRRAVDRDVLEALLIMEARGDALTQIDIADRSGWSRPAVISSLERLEDDGYIKRGPAHHGRSVVGVTDRARGLIL